ncbi:MAG: hypothetical protein ACRCX2_36475 [Paraclostridium sp.]
MQNITKEKLIYILKNKAVDCFIHDELLVVDMPNRVVFRNIENKQEYVDIFLYNLNKKAKEKVKRHVWHYTNFEEKLIKLNYNDIDFLVKRTGRTRNGILRKIKNMKAKGEIKDYSPFHKNKIEGIIDNIRQCRISEETKSKILLDIGKTLKGVETYDN